MRRLHLGLVLAILAAAPSLSHAETALAAKQADGEGARLLFEIGAGPISGLDDPLRGAAAGLLVGASIGPIEAGFRPSLAYDASLSSLSLRADLVLGIGDGVRLIAGGIVPLSPAILEPEGVALALEAGKCPCRFGLESRLTEARRGPFGSSFSASAAIVYSAYRIGDEAAAAPEAALAGTAAFAACIELRVSIDLAWRLRLRRRTGGGTP